METDTQNKIALNCARNSLRYVVRAFRIEEIYIPFYTCPTVWQALKKENCRIKFYHIDENFMPVVEFNPNDYVLYTNYFGICSKNVLEMSKKYKNLIVDNAHAFYSKPVGIASFNSLRKFFDVFDGSFLYTDKILDYELEKDSLMEFSFTFEENEKRICNLDLSNMSNFTISKFKSINVEEEKTVRLKQFKGLDEILGINNKLKIDLADNVPMVYPFMAEDKTVRKNLEKAGFYVEQYWNSTSGKFIESSFQKEITPIPIGKNIDFDRVLSSIV